MDERENKIINIVADQFDLDADTLTRETHLFNDLQMDSLDIVEIVMELEDEFQIHIEDEKAERCKTIRDVTDLVFEKVNEPGDSN